MTDLTADVNDNQVYWKVSDMPVADYLQADDEIVRIIYRLAQHEEVYVERGCAGTTAASHSSGALTTLWVPGGGSSDALSGTLLGPFHVAFDDSFPVTSTLTVPAGGLVVAAYCFVSEAWDQDRILLVTDPTGAQIGAFAVGSDWWSGDPTRSANRVIGQLGFGVTADYLVGNDTEQRFAAPTALHVNISTGGDSDTEGQADIYALVLT